MPWARFDDHMPTHRKVRPLTDAAFRLWVSAICWSNANGTDSVVLRSEINFVSDVKRPTRAVAQLVAIGLWEEIEDGWRIHDFHDYNKSTAQVTAERKLKTERQGKWRANKKTDSVDASTAPSTDASRDAAPARPDPSYALPTEVQQQRAGARERPAGAPVEVIPLVDELTAEGFVVTWDLQFVDWDRIRVAIERSGIPALIDHVRKRHTSARSPAYSARAWIQGWSSLPPLPAGARLAPVQASRPSTSDQRVADGMALVARIAAEDGVPIPDLFGPTIREITS